MCAVFCVSLFGISCTHMIEFKLKCSLFIYSRKTRYLKLNSATISPEERLNTDNWTQQITSVSA